MATVIDSISIQGMTKTQLQQLCNYIRWVEDFDIYYGNKGQFFDRHRRLLRFADYIEELISDVNVRIKR